MYCNAFQRNVQYCDAIYCTVMYVIHVISVCTYIVHTRLASLDRLCSSGSHLFRVSVGDGCDAKSLRMLDDL